MQGKWFFYFSSKPWCVYTFSIKFLPMKNWSFSLILNSKEISVYNSYSEDHCKCERKSWLTNLKALNRINPGSVSFVGSPFMALIKKLVAKQATIEEKNWKEKKNQTDISCTHRLIHLSIHFVSLAKYNLPLSMLDPDSKSWLLLLN